MATTIQKAVSSVITYSDLRKIVWDFADFLRDKGSGQVEDYARITIPTLALKRILDLKDETLEAGLSSQKAQLEIGLIDVQQALKTINDKSIQFYDENALFSSENKFLGILISWADLMAYPENPNKDTKELKLAYNSTYKTTAKNFVELMFEIIDTFSPRLRQVFKNFDAFPAACPHVLVAG